MYLYSLLLLQALDLGCFGWLLLASIIPFLLGLLLGFLLWQHYKRKSAEYLEERDRYHAQFTDMEKQYVSLKYEHEELQKETQKLRAALHSAEADVAVYKTKLQRAIDEAKAAGVVAAGMELSRGGQDPAPIDTSEQDRKYALLFSPDNLQVIEGIGAKVEDVLRSNGITDWKAVAGTSPERLVEILAAAGATFRMINPATWPRQAKLAADGKWTELIAFQKQLDTGRDNQGDMDTPSKAEKAAFLILGFSGTEPTHLTIIEGIGPKIEQLLKDAGILTWSDLAAASVDQLKAILASSGGRFRLADPSTWPQQARLAADGQWQELREYQDQLQGGKE